MAATTNLITSFVRRISKYFNSTNFTWGRPKRATPGANHIDNPTDFDARTIYRGEEIIDFTKGNLYTQDGGEIIELNKPNGIVSGLRVVEPSVVGAFGGGSLWVSVESGVGRIYGKNYYHEPVSGTASGDIQIQPNPNLTKARIDIIALKSGYPNPAPVGVVGSFGVDSTEYAAGLTAISGSLYNQGRALTFLGDYSGSGTTITINSPLSASAISIGDNIIGINITGAVTVTNVTTSGGFIVSIDISATPIAASTNSIYALPIYASNVCAIKGDISAGSNVITNVYPQPLLNDLIIGQGIPEGTVATNVATIGSVTLSNSATLTKTESIFQIGDVVDHILYDTTAPWPVLPEDHTLLGLVYVPSNYTALSTPNTLRPWSVSDLWTASESENQTPRSLVSKYISQIQEYTSDTTYMSGSTIIDPQAQSINRVVKNHYSSDLDTSLSTGMMVQIATNGVVGGATGGTATLVYSVTYAQLETLILGSSLVEGAYYVINDFETVYDRPDYNADGSAKSVIDTITAAPELIMVLATSTYTIDTRAYSLDFPKHQIKYDYDFKKTEYNNSPAKGRISERIDSNGNRADYDTEAVYFKRYTYYFSNNVAYTGNINFYGTINVIGIGTLFTSELAVGDVFIAGGYSFKVDTIIDDFTMTIVSNNHLYSSLGDSFYGATYYDFTKKEDYRDNNTNDYQLVKTFGADCYNNYIGDNLGFLSSPNWLLSNNTIRANSIGNKLGLACRNNHFFEQSYSNVFGNECFGNIQTNSTNFGNNTIGNSFSNNILTNFYQNTIGNICSSNIFGAGFGLNIIDNYFQNNIMGDNFENNVVGNSFQGNLVGNTTNRNTIGYGFINNILGDTFTTNAVDTDFANNQIGINFESNVIAHGFDANIIGLGFSDNVLGSGFKGNTIGDDFNNNICKAGFDTNIIGNNFQSNIINTDISMTDFTLSTYVYQTYTCELIERADGTKRLKYMDNTDAIVVDDIDN